MSDKTITFRELVRLIHPDVNKNIVDAGGKMATAKLYRNEPVELYKLAIRWGVVVGVNPQPQQRTTTRQERTWDTGRPMNGARQAPPRNNSQGTSQQTRNERFQDELNRLRRERAQRQQREAREARLRREAETRARVERARRLREAEVRRQQAERERVRRVREAEALRRQAEINARNQRETLKRWDATKPLVWKSFPDERPVVGSFVYVHTLSRIRVQVVRTTPRRVYFFHNNRRTFANKDNVSVARQVRD